MSMPDMVNCAAACDAPRSSATAGREGRYMSVVMAGSAARAPSIRIHFTEERRSDAAVAVLAVVTLKP
jgi:hypothetical protein